MLNSQNSQNSELTKLLDILAKEKYEESIYRGCDFNHIPKPRAGIYTHTRMNVVRIANLPECTNST